MWFTFKGDEDGSSLHLCNVLSEGKKAGAFYLHILCLTLKFYLDSICSRQTTTFQLKQFNSMPRKYR